MPVRVGRTNPTPGIISHSAIALTVPLTYETLTTTSYDKERCSCAEIRGIIVANDFSTLHKDLYYVAVNVLDFSGTSNRAAVMIIAQVTTFYLSVMNKSSLAEEEIIDPSMHADLYKEAMKYDRYGNGQISFHVISPSDDSVRIVKHLALEACDASANCFVYTAAILGKRFLLAALKGLKNDREVRISHKILALKLVRYADFTEYSGVSEARIPGNLLSLDMDPLPSAYIFQVLHMPPEFRFRGECADFVVGSDSKCVDGLVLCKCSAAIVMCEPPRDGIMYAMADPEKGLI
ncbi:hypothetical protein KIN20_032413 [Parelaphostrongylus tenuis]|uniref:Uncharacterized protein n=1 Tax=Parelaphostrongylus tenuis TaxID=148309 RepID=A0AAD5WI18_PARTN|nr:hypothetical protein KIN20_032413 [Parelaphostrongylus tenuis]